MVGLRTRAGAEGEARPHEAGPCDVGLRRGRNKGPPQI